jgi:hypothetical protein
MASELEKRIWDFLLGEDRKYLTGLNAVTVERLTEELVESIEPSLDVSDAQTLKRHYDRYGKIVATSTIEPTS